MATAVAHSSNSTKPLIGVPGRCYDHLFFSAMGLLILATVFTGFVHTYDLAGAFHSPLPSLIVHLHGTAFSCWILLLAWTLLRMSAWCPKVEESEGRQRLVR